MSWPMRAGSLATSNFWPKRRPMLLKAYAGALPQPGHESAKRLHVSGREPPGLQTREEQLDRLAWLHGIHDQALGIGGKDILVACGYQAGTAFSPVQKRLEVHAVAHVIDHQQDVAFSQQFRQASSCRVNACEAWPLITEHVD